MMLRKSHAAKWRIIWGLLYVWIALCAKTIKKIKQNARTSEEITFINYFSAFHNYQILTDTFYFNFQASNQIQGFYFCLFLHSRYEGKICKSLYLFTRNKRNYTTT